MALALLLWALVPAGAQPSVDARRVHLGTTGTTCTLHSGSGAPSTGLGAVCDVYHRTDSPYTVYLKTGASTWTALASLPSGATAGDLLTAASGTATGRVAAVATGQVLASAGTGTAPAYTASPSLTSIGGAANLTLNPTGDLVLNPTGNDVLPGTGYDIRLGALTNKYLELHAAELWVETLVAQDTLATIGGRVLVGPTTTLTSDLAAASTSMVVKHDQIANGDRVVLQAGGQVEWIAVTSGPSGSGPYTYSVTRNLDGSGANDWTAGDAVFNTGTTGDGFIDLYSYAGILSGAGPTIVGNVRTGTTYSQVAPRWAIGNLNGLYGYGSDIYGAAFGDNSAAWVKVDPTNGVRLGHGSTTYVDITAGGDATFSGRITVGTGRNWLSNTEFLRGRGTGDGYRSYWGGSSGTASVDPSATYTCAGVQCVNRAQHGSSLWSWPGVSKTSGIGDATVALAGASNRPLGGGAVSISIAGTPANATLSRLWGPTMPVIAGQRYELSAYLGMSGAWTSRIYVVWWGEDGVDAGDAPDYVSETPGSACTSGTATSDLSTWCRSTLFVTAPAGSRLASVLVQSEYDGGDATPVTYVTRPYLGEAGAAQTSATPWGPGGQTLITGDMLSTDLVIANTLRSAGATALDTGTGYWLDASSTPTFRVGNPSGNQIKWDGTNLVIGQGVVTLDSSGIKITPDTTTGNYVPGNAYRFDVVSGRQLGMSGHVQSAQIQSLNLIATTNSTDSGASSTVNVLATTPSSTSGTNAAQIAAVSNRSQGEVIIIANKNGAAFGGEIRLYGIPDFRGGTSGSAGSSAGYINVLVGGTSYRIQVFNP